MPVMTRSALGFLAATGIVVGVWAYAFPFAFYRSFPGFGRAWVVVDGPFNEHLVRDTGAAYLMIAALAGLGLVRPRVAPAFTVGSATLCFNLAHGIYHLTHLGMYGALDQALNIVVLGLAVACSIWLMTPAARGCASSNPPN